MKRKVIQIAGSTQLVSLPRKWSIEHNLMKGDELEVEEEGNTLLVSTGKAVDSGSVEVDVSSLDRDSLMFLIRALYKNGYDEIILNFKNSRVYSLRDSADMGIMDVIAKEVSRLNGMEIIIYRFKVECIQSCIGRPGHNRVDFILAHFWRGIISQIIGFKYPDKLFFIPFSDSCPGIWGDIG